MLSPSIGAYPDRYDSSDTISRSALPHLSRSSKTAGDRGRSGQDRHRRLGLTWPLRYRVRADFDTGALTQQSAAGNLASLNAGGTDFEPLLVAAGTLHHVHSLHIGIPPAAGAAVGV